MLNLVRWNPLREMSSLEDRFSRFFDEGFVPAHWRVDDHTIKQWTPVVDVFENDNNFVIKAELPGMDMKDIDVEVKDRILTLKGERCFENEVKEESYYRKERAHGKFERRFTLPSEIDADKIKAEYKDGVLEIEIPKPEEKKPRKISVH